MVLVSGSAGLSRQLVLVGNTVIYCRKTKTPGTPWTFTSIATPFNNRNWRLDRGRLEVGQEPEVKFVLVRNVLHDVTIITQQ